MTEDISQVPQYTAYMNPILDVLRTSERGELSIEELDRRVFAAMQLPGGVIAVPHDAARADRSEAGYRAAWARTYLKKVGLVDNLRRGMWSLTDSGRTTTTIDTQAVVAQVARELGRDRLTMGEEDEESSELDSEAETARVTEPVATQLRELKEHLSSTGDLLSRDEVVRYLRRFRDRFGPDALADLDGEALLTAIHGRGARDSLVYWLEFKDDDELPARFGGIGGGSALKFGIYQSAETGRWMAGSSRQQRTLTIDEAIAFARRQRGELVAGARVLGGYARAGLDVDYTELQGRLAEAAPELAGTSWGHKYFALVSQDLLEMMHGAETQRYHLLKLLKLPAEGRYENARIFSGIARQLDMTLFELSTVLHRRHGPAHTYWRVGTKDGGVDEWPRMRDGAFAAVGWSTVGDLSEISNSATGRDLIREQLQRGSSGPPQVITRGASQLFDFARTAQDRDVVVAMDGVRVRGVGRIIGPYFHRSDDGPFPHRRPVQWLPVDEWRLPDAERLQTTFTRLGKSARNIIEIESRLMGAPGTPSPAFSGSDALVAATTSPAPTQPAPLPVLTGTPARVQAALYRKRQVILYGPPGTGKTYWAERAAQELVARSWFQQSWEQLGAGQRSALETARAIEICAFHPAYGYEDFLEGHRPVLHDGSLSFRVQDGVFKQLCDRARRDRTHDYLLIIDEINRGDIPRIFGELLTVLERDKRNKSVTLPLSGSPFSVPDNVLLIGTMNTADRSIALLDAALRRRFAFIELLPDSTPLRGISVGGLPLGPWLDELNRRVVQHAGRDARNLQIGHSYLLPGGNPVRELGVFAEILRDDIIPLLEEYCYGNFDALASILGDRIVLKAKQRIDSALLEPDRHDDLLQTLLSAFAGVTTTLQAVQADMPTDQSDDGESTDGEL